MKHIFIAFTILCFVAACKNSNTADKDITTESTTANPEASPVTMPQNDPATTQATPPPVNAEPAQNAKGVWHFTCPKGCKGGAGTVGPCGKCGATLAHNQAYHETVTQAQPNINQAVPTTSATQQPMKEEPAQNAKGVWHFTCAKGCAGGAGKVGLCAKCGGTLAHNQAYHQ